MILLDTCALLWWTLDPEKLSKKAVKACQTIETDGCLISSISLWEIGVKIKNKKLDLGISLKDYTSKIKEMNLVNIVPVDESIWLLNLELNWNHKDPADRTIVATAKQRQALLMTPDTEIKKFYKNVIW